MNRLDDWPEPVARHIRQTYGEPVAAERLSGMSLSAVYRLHCGSRALIVKMSPEDWEARFYERVAGPLRRAGVGIPVLEQSIHLPDSHWLILEEIPKPLLVLQQVPWQPDPRVVTMLARLHAATRDWSPDLPEARTRSWTDAATEGALSCFPLDTAVTLAPMLRALQHESAHRCQPWCWISGDPNPTNWGVRADGSLVLFDWAEFRPGLPAIDLAITAAGLGDRARFAALAASYMEAWHAGNGPIPWSNAELARDIALAKVWTVVSFLDGYSQARVRPLDGLIEALIANVPAWVRGLG